MRGIPVAISQAVGRKILELKKESPHIFFVGGIIGTVASTVLACRATLKLSEKLDVIQSDLNAAKELKDEDPKDSVYIYARAGLEITKLYAPAIIVGAASIAALTGSHIQLTRRNAALMAAYGVLQQAFDDYRERVREELGEDKELEVYRAIRDEKVGKEVIKVVDPNKWSAYARFFDEGSPFWRKDPELNFLFVRCQQQYANDLLRARGHVFLNEVYDALGIDRCKAGAVVGWVIGASGDNYVSFNIYEAYQAQFVNGWERSILLDFNVDGVIYDKI